MTSERGHYSLDDIVPRRAVQHIDGSPVAWMIVGHAIWAIGLALAVLAGAPAGLWAAAGAHLLAVLLVVVAWGNRARSVAAARAVAWVSTPLFGIAVAVLAVAFVGSVWELVTYEDPEFEASFAPVLGVLLLVGLLILSVPTVGAFVASVSHARSLRRA